MQKQVDKADIKLHHLDFLRAFKDQIQKGKYPHSVEETERRQGLSVGLLHVSDNVFEFFLTVYVEEERQKLHTFSSLQKHKSKVLAHATSDLRQNESIKSNMMKMFKGMEGMHEDIAIEVANEILDSYLRVCNNFPNLPEDKNADKENL